jgi:hypothetical protein
MLSFGPIDVVIRKIVMKSKMLSVKNFPTENGG